MMTKDQIQSEINGIQNEIKLLEEKISNTEEEREGILLKKLLSIEKTDATLSLLNEAMEVNEENSMTVTLRSDTKTTPIMDEFYNSKKRFLIFDDIFYLGKSYTRSSLIVVKARRGCMEKDSNLTMTILKDKAGMLFSGDNSCHYEKTRFYALAEELSVAVKKITVDSTTIPFETPVRLGGQTFANQTGYGSIYEGEYQVTQGTLYGETTGFYIIGIKIHG